MVVTERDQEKASDELWNLSAEFEKELRAKEACHEFGRDELPVGQVGRTDVGSSEDREDLGRTRKWRGTVAADLGPGNTGKI